jgi:hypothetical protein
LCLGAFVSLCFQHMLNLFTPSMSARIPLGKTDTFGN